MPDHPMPDHPMPERRSLLLTRPVEQSRAFAEALEIALPDRFAPVVSPVLTVARTEGAIPLDEAQGLLFTSANGVAQFAARTADRRLPALCVGEMTAEAARRAGFSAESAGGDVPALTALAVARHRPGGGDFIHVRGRHAAGDLIGRLALAGVPARAAEIYDQLPCPLTAEVRSMLADGQIDVICLFSPRSAALLARQLVAGGWNLRRVICVALSGAADAGLIGVEPARRVIAAAPTRAGMIGALGGL